jgi:nitrate/nitrite transport system substrate-binding protein
MTQHKRWGLLKGEPDYLATATSVNQTKLYGEAAALAKVSVPKSVLRSVKMIDGTLWDGKNPKAYADAFKIKA